MKYRYEFDSLGKIKVPSNKYWGASTQRSNKHFDIGDFLVRPIVIKSIAMIKKAAAIVNAKNGDIEKNISKVIVKVANEIIKPASQTHQYNHKNCIMINDDITNYKTIQTLVQ